MLGIVSPAFDGAVTISDEQWRLEGRNRCARALAKADAAPDRLALLREWARLNDGHVTLNEIGCDLGPDEFELLSAFGLEVIGKHLRISSSIGALPPSIARTFRLDSTDRRLFDPASPDALLLRWSSHAVYRSETQKAALRALATMPSGSSLMVSMPTGTGKSLLFQVAPNLWEKEAGNRCAVVITPTIALALDHERTLSSIPGLEGSRALTSQLSFGERSETLDAFRRGEIPILLLSPEQAFGAAREALIEAAKPPSQKFGLAARLTCFFVDEAHIIESWGRSFRPDFQRLPGLVEELRAQNGELRTILLSATIGQSARTQLRQAYGQADWLEIHAGVPRYEFDIAGECFNTPEDRDRAVMTTVHHAPRPAILYTNLVAHARDLHDALISFGYRRIALFTGEVSDGATRQDIITRWANEELDLIVATSAFGMGVDKANVRTVIHGAFPESPSRYYQEIGRAARDGRQGIGVSLWYEDGSPEDDKAQAKGLASGSWISREKAEKRWRSIRQWGLENGAFTWAGTRRRLTVNLDAIREGLDGKTSDYNRLWNMSVLNWLQRGKAIQVSGVTNPHADVPTWQIDILDDALLADGPKLDLLWDKLESLRLSELQVSRGEFAKFHRLMKGATGGCILTGVYGLIDPGCGMVADCGRCPACRERHVSPPRHIKSGDLDRIWTEEVRRASPLPPGVTMIVPHDPELRANNASLMNDLADLGFEQFVVPDQLVEEIARNLAGSSCQFGFTLTHSDLLGGKWELAHVPTALLFDRTDGEIEQLWARLKSMAVRAPIQRFAVIASPDTRAEGRPLQQVASKQAPISEGNLRALINAKPKAD